jgi:elongator complex protein 3
LQLDDLVYPAGGAEEHFLSYTTPDDRIAGFLRLSLPIAGSPVKEFSELTKAAIIREVHVFGQSLPVGVEESGAAQHIGLGTQLIREAEEIARGTGYPRLAVISAIGTRRYYLRQGFQPDELYMLKDLNKA